MALIGCLTWIVPATTHGQTCTNPQADISVVGGIACPDSAAATVVPNDVAIPPQVTDDLQAFTPAETDDVYNADLSAQVTAPDEIGSGSAFFVTWTGPDNTSDFIAIAEPMMRGNSYANYTYTQRGSPLPLTAPDEPGQYEIRYIDQRSRSILANQPVTVLATSATLQFGSQISSGGSFEVSWSGPANQSDYISIATPGTPGGQQHHYRYVEQGSPLDLRAPDEPGDYEIRYVQQQSRNILASKSITVTPVVATLDASGDVQSGGSFEVSWSGPANQSDYISIATPGTPGGQQHHYRYVEQGSPLDLRAPDEPGDYEIRYVQQQSRNILASKSITVTPVVATLDASGDVQSGGSFDVSWSGPANQSDYISIATPGTPGGQQHHYRYVEQGSPLDLRAPDEPGDYEIRYVQQQSRNILARKSITVTPVVATLDASGDVQSGGNFEVSWSGPANQSDYISIATPGTPGGQQHHYRYVEQGSPLDLRAPDEPGDYEIRYVQQQSRNILARRTIKVIN